MFYGPCELWFGANCLPDGWDPGPTLKGVEVTDEQIGGVFCHREVIFGLPFRVPADDPLAVLVNSYYRSSLPGRGNPDWSTPLEVILEVRSKLREIGLELHPVYYFHFAEAYAPLEGAVAWEYAARRGFPLLIQDQAGEQSQLTPAEIGLTSWDETTRYLEAAWRKAVEQTARVPKLAPIWIPEHWIGAAWFANSD